MSVFVTKIWHEENIRLWIGERLPTDNEMSITYRYQDRCYGLSVLVKRVNTTCSRILQLTGYIRSETLPQQVYQKRIFIFDFMFESCSLGKHENFKLQLIFMETWNTWAGLLLAYLEILQSTFEWSWMIKRLWQVQTVEDLRSKMY